MRIAVYILANGYRGTLYIGVTSNLSVRIHQHKTGLGGVFTKRYKCHNLVYYEAYESIVEAIAREKQLKGGSRKAKIDLVEAINPGWIDWYERLNQ